MTDAICLAVSGLVVAWLTPVLLRGQVGRGDAPRVAVLAWFAGAVAAVVLWLAAASHLIADSDVLGRFVGILLASALVARLAWVIGHALRRNRQRQRDHLDTARVVARHDVRPGVLVIDAPEPAVYCVPSGEGVVVMSRGAHELLSEAEAEAVLVHERTHLNEHHHVLVTVARALQAAFPWLNLFTRMGAQVALLLEMRADDAAVRACGHDTVLGAFASLCLTEAPTGTLAAHGPTLVHRVTRLTDPTSRWRGRIGVATTVVTAVALAAVPLLGAWLPYCPHPLI